MYDYYEVDKHPFKAFLSISAGACLSGYLPGTLRHGVGQIVVCGSTGVHKTPAQGKTPALLPEIPLRLYHTRWMTLRETSFTPKLRLPEGATIGVRLFLCTNFITLTIPQPSHHGRSTYPEAIPRLDA